MTAFFSAFSSSELEKYPKKQGGKTPRRKAIKLGAIEINIENFYVRLNCVAQFQNMKDCVFHFKIIALLIFFTKIPRK